MADRGIISAVIQEGVKFVNHTGNYFLLILEALSLELLFWKVDPDFIPNAIISRNINIKLYLF